jgi:CubicO group peptidase (beta-lactamase class C family)
MLASSARAELAAHELTRPDVDAWLEGFFPYALADGDIAGAAVVIVKDGEVLALRGYGHADVDKRTPVDPARTLFRTGSVGKLFTWTAVMQQVEAGRLDLDRDVNDYLDFRIPARDGPAGHAPEPDDAHAGLRRAGEAPRDGSARPCSDARAICEGLDAEADLSAGQIPAYSNYGVTLAGYILERVSGEPYDDYIDRHVFAPLGMTQSTTRQPLPAALRAQMSNGYLKGSGRAYPFELFGVSPAGSATTTAADMGRFMLAWLQGGELGSARILEPDTVRLTLETKLPIVPPLNSMLLGFFEETLNGRRVVGHRGDSQYFHSTLNLFPDDGVGVYLVVNSTGRDGASETVITGFMSAFADRYFPATCNCKHGERRRCRAARPSDGGHIPELSPAGIELPECAHLPVAGEGHDRRAWRPPRARPPWRERRTHALAGSPPVCLESGRRQGTPRARVRDGRVELWRSTPLRRSS